MIIQEKQSSTQEMTISSASTMVSTIQNTKKRVF